MARTEKDINKLLEKFNKLDVSPMSTRDYVLGLDQAKAGIKNLSQKEADRLFPDKLTDEDIDNLRAAREQEVALKRGLIAANEAKTVTKRTKAIANAGKPKAGIESLNFFKKEREKAAKQQVDIEKLKQEFQPQAQVIKASKTPEETQNVFNSGVNNLPAILKSKEEKESESFDNSSSANFDYDFLISTKGELHKEPLMDILISTWEEFNGVDDELKSDKLKKQGKGGAEEEDSGPGLLEALLGMSFFDLIFSPFKKLAKNAFKKLAKIAKKVIRAIKKPFKKLIKEIKKGIKGIQKKLSKFIKNARKMVKNMIKNARKQIKQWWKSLKSSAKSFVKSVKAQAKEVVKKAKDYAKRLKSQAKAMWKEAEQALKRAKKALSDALEKGAKKLKSGVNKVKNVAKKSLKKTKSAGKALLKKTFEKAKSGVNKVKNVAKVGVKKVKKVSGAIVTKTKNTAKSTIEAVKNSKAAKNAAKIVKNGKSAAKGVLSKVPVVSAAVDLGFMAYDINEVQNETGATVDEAMGTYLEEKKKEGHSWWEVIDPFAFGQQIALDLGIDKLAGNVAEWAVDKVMGSPEERQKKIQAEAEARKEEAQARLQAYREQKANIQQPQELENPDYRYTPEPETPVTPRPSVTIVFEGSNFSEDGDELPYGGFSYGGAY